MATSKPRVQVLLTPEVLKVYAKAAHLFGVSASKLAGEVLKEAAPAIEEIAVLMHQAKQDQASAGLRAAEGMVNIANKARATLDVVQLDLEDEIESVKASQIDSKRVKPVPKEKARPKARSKPKA